MYILRYYDFLNENKLYGKLVIDSLLSKFGSDSLNLINIFGLFRNTKPFSGKDIQKLSKNDLNTLYDELYKSIINSYETAFDNKSKDIKEYLDAYISNIANLKDKAKPFNSPDELINMVETNKLIQTTQSTEISIANPNPKDVLYEDNNVIIINTDSHTKCKLYGKGEKWCISGDGNHYNGYRANKKATIYMVYQKNEEYPLNKLVIMVYPQGYSIADQTNSNKRAGLVEYAKGWSEIESELPNLKGLEKYFEDKPLTDQEIRYKALFNDFYVDDDLFEYIKNICKGLVINGKEINVYDCFSDYIKKYKDTLTVGQVLKFNERCISICIECFHDFFELTYTQFLKLFNNRQQNRYLRLAKEHNYKINNILLKEDYEVYIGNYECLNKNLTSLKDLNIPKFIKGNFLCNNNQLTSLEGAPIHVEYGFYCSNNQLTSLEGVPNYVGGSFLCNNNQLTSLEGAPNHVIGDFICFDNKLTSLEGGPNHVVRSFNCSGNQLKSLEGAPNYVGSRFDCSDNEDLSKDIIEAYKKSGAVKGFFKHN